MTKSQQLIVLNLIGKTKLKYFLNINCELIKSKLHLLSPNQYIILDMTNEGKFTYKFSLIMYKLYKLQVYLLDARPPLSHILQLSFHVALLVPHCQTVGDFDASTVIKRNTNVIYMNVFVYYVHYDACIYINSMSRIF